MGHDDKATTHFFLALLLKVFIYLRSYFQFVFDSVPAAVITVGQKSRY
jgi:hypothetical protein